MDYTALISPSALEPRLQDDGWAVIDCRHQLSDAAYGRRVYAEGHIPGARFAHMDETLAAPVTAGSGRHPLPDMERFAGWLGGQGVGNDTQVIVYDDDSGVMAARLWWMLRYLGHGKVAVLDGGMARWKRERRPMEDRVPAPAPARFSARPDEGARISLEDLLGVYRSTGHLLVDARGAERFEGKSEPIDPVAGHIPGAANRPFMANLAGDGTFLPPTALKEQLLAAFGSAPPERTIHYCGSGVSACHNLLAMAHAGLPAGRLYVGSWSQWCADPARPVETGPAQPRN